MQPPSASGSPRKVLAVVWSQTGQLSAIGERMLAPLRDDPGISLTVETLRPQRAHPFPWPFFRFLDAFPESAHMVPGELAPLALAGDEDFDLVVLFYQVWFLAPSQPIVAFLHDARARRALAGKPVVTVIACRNMWMMAHARMTGLLREVGARLKDNVVLTDTAPTLVTLLTTPLWLLTGRKAPVRGLPPAGVPQVDIDRSIRFGRALRDALHAGRERDDAPMLDGLQAVVAQPQLLVSERAGTRSFHVWGKLLRLAGPPGAWPRVPLLVLYVVFLLAIIVTVVPVSLTLQALLRPLLQRRLAALKARFEQPSGSGTERLPQYDF